VSADETGLLQAYAFWKIGQIALWAGISSFVLAGIMLLLTVFGGDAPAPRGPGG